MARKRFIEVSTDTPVMVLGRQFQNLRAIRMAVGKYARITGSLLGGRTIFGGTPKECPKGLYVLQMYEPYPCFDSYDYANEDRDYCNYFFSEKPFTNKQIEQLAHVKKEMDCRIINENTPGWAFPAVYYCGYGDTMIIATLK